MPTAKKRKQKISQKLRQEVWLHHFGPIFSGKCPIEWCSQEITVFTFEAGHNKPESKGGATSIENLIPICSGCNRGMGDTYTISEYSRLYASKQTLPPVLEEEQDSLEEDSSAKAGTSSHPVKPHWTSRFLSYFSKKTRVSPKSPSPYNGVVILSHDTTDNKNKHFSIRQIFPKA